jgi:fructuronate reductase
MKVCTCLNPLHTALAIFGCSLGHDSISKEMGDEDLRTLVPKMSQRESVPVVTEPGLIDPKRFLQEVLPRVCPTPLFPIPLRGLPKIPPRNCRSIFGRIFRTT